MTRALRDRLDAGEAREVLAGAGVFAILMGFVLTSTLGLSATPDATQTFVARFAKADGITRGSEVRIAGVSVGRVVGQTLDEFNRAVLTLGLDAGVVLDVQASASIATDGLFGAKHIDIEIGGGEENIPPGGEIAYTEPSLLIEDLLELIVARARESRAKGTPEGK